MDARFTWAHGNATSNDSQNTTTTKEGRIRMSRIYSTPKGTELPLLNLRGKDYLEVKYRLVWFREEHPTWSIETEYTHVTGQSAVAKAVIRDDNGRTIATSHKAESASNFPDFMEKAETGAIGRALALIGFGTQFCADELDEGDRIVDAPVTPPGLTTSKTDLGEYKVPFGKKYIGKRLKDIPQEEIEGYVSWLENNSSKKNQSIPPEVSLLKNAVDRYFHPEKYTSKSSDSQSSPQEQVS